MKYKTNINVALSLNKNDAWAVHARAHVMEMEGRSKEGVEFLQNTCQDWQTAGGLACHNYWHLGLKKKKRKRKRKKKKEKKKKEKEKKGKPFSDLTTCKTSVNICKCFSKRRRLFNC